MISHKYKCIFIHISRTAGTSIEAAICGRDWWDIDPATKHLTASQSQELYHKWWNKYFKFSILRNPYDRMISCYHMDYFNGHIPLAYRNIIKQGPQIGYESGCGFSYFLRNYKPPPWEQGGLIEYTDILDLSLDFIGDYNNLHYDFNFICKTIGLVTPLPHFNKTNHLRVSSYYDNTSINMIQKLYASTLKQYRYEYHV